MINTNIELKDIFDAVTGGVVTTYVLDSSHEIDANRKRPAVIICPGGGYRFCSEREAECFAVRFMAMGYHAFVLNYRVDEARFPEQFKEVAATVALLRSKAEEWHIEADKIAVMGFSAGGHLAGTLGTMWNSPILTDAFNMDSEVFKPNALILSYPVITYGEFAHTGSFDNLLGEEKDPQLLHDLSLENAVGPHVPQTFIWHTLGDTTVPPENSLLFAQELRKNNVPFELHIFPEGRHGLALVNEETAPPSMLDEYVLPHTAQWFNLCCDWLKTRFK